MNQFSVREGGDSLRFKYDPVSADDMEDYDSFCYLPTCFTTQEDRSYIELGGAIAVEEGVKVVVLDRGDLAFLCKNLGGHCTGHYSCPFCLRLRADMGLFEILGDPLPKIVAIGPPPQRERHVIDTAKPRSREECEEVVKQLPILVQRFKDAGVNQKTIDDFCRDYGRGYVNVPHMHDAYEMSFYGIMHMFSNVVILLLNLLIADAARRRTWKAVATAMREVLNDKLAVQPPANIPDKEPVMSPTGIAAGVIQSLEGKSSIVVLENWRAVVEAALGEKVPVRSLVGVARAELTDIQCYDDLGRSLLLLKSMCYDTTVGDVKACVVDVLRARAKTYKIETKKAAGLWRKLFALGFQKFMCVPAHVLFDHVPEQMRKLADIGIPFGFISEQNVEALNGIVKEWFGHSNHQNGEEANNSLEQLLVNVLMNCMLWRMESVKHFMDIDMEYQTANPPVQKKARRSPRPTNVAPRS